MTRSALIVPQQPRLTTERARLVAIEVAGEGSFDLDAVGANTNARAALCLRDAPPASASTPSSSDQDFRLASPRGPTLAQVVASLPADVRHSLLHTIAQERVLRHVLDCRTSAMGGVLEWCARCQYSHPVHRSCGDRHCPCCQALASERWVNQALKRTLRVRYFHVVLTLPPELRALTFANQRKVYGLLFSSAKAAIFGVAKERLDAQLGVTAVLHTWNRHGNYHPHLHAIVTAGGLTADGEWAELGDPGQPRLPRSVRDQRDQARRTSDRPGRGDSRPDRVDRASDRGTSLLPLDRLRAEFRESFLSGLGALYREGELQLPGTRDTSPAQRDVAWENTIARAQQRLWHVYAKRTLEGAEDAFRYLARYTTRVGITNNRIVSFDRAAGRVEYCTKRGERLEITAAELVRRFLLHVLPSGFHRIRHFGLFASRNGKIKLPVARAALAARRGEPPESDPDVDSDGDSPPKASASASAEPEPERQETIRELLLRLKGIDIGLCPRCRGPLSVYPFRPHVDTRVMAATIRSMQSSRARLPP